MIDSANIILAVRTSPGAALTAEEIKKAIWAITRDQPVFNIQSMTKLVNLAVAEPRYVAQLLGAFALVALVMSAAGVV